MGTAQEYTDFYNSETSLARTLVGDGLADRISNGGADRTSTEETKSFEAPERAIAPTLKPLQGNFRLLQMWEGRVVSVDEEQHEFTAIVKDKTDQSLPDEKLTMSIEEVPPNDLSLVAAGAVFYWSIGYADYPGRPRTRESRIRFRRLPKWQQSELDNAVDQGRKLAEFFANY